MACGGWWGFWLRGVLRNQKYALSIFCGKYWHSALEMLLDNGIGSGNDDDNEDENENENDEKKSKEEKETTKPHFLCYIFFLQNSCENFFNERQY